MSLDQYDNPKLWTLTDERPGRQYASVPTARPVNWKQQLGLRKLAYTSGEYAIVRNTAGRSVTYTLFRLDVELPLGFYSRLKDAKARAVKNAAGKDRMRVA
jgi:hypothetical protein